MGGDAVLLQDPEDDTPEQSQAPQHRWTAQMIHPLADQGEGTPASFVAREFSLRAVRGDETLRVSALGLYRVFLNGKRVGDDLLTPGWTCYDKRIAFQTYPVADLLQPGPNRIEIWLADGWYRSQIMWRDEAIFNCWGDKIGALAEIASGDEVLVRTDGSWESGSLPILRSGIYFGETYDARLEGRPTTAGVEVLEFAAELPVAQECRAGPRAGAVFRAGELDRSQGAHRLRLRPECGRLRCLHGARECRRAGDRRAFGDRRP